MAEVNEPEKRANSLSSRSSSPPPRHDTDVHNPLSPAPLLFVSLGSLQVGPASTVREDELCDWQERYSLPSSVVLRIPRLSIRASGGMLEEIAIYEDFFESGFRAWRILIAIQNLRDEEDLAFGVNEVLFAYHLAPMNGHEGRFHLRPTMASQD
ncbi:hypothetical protein Rs2_40996 [Raphanus sativus]|nr:hypothetical protein Rs2_40996 [Raphanus sativus]